MPLACVLISDVTGSTQLFEAHSSEVATKTITNVTERMREIIDANKGTFVKSQGDDTLSYFTDSDAAFLAAWSMIAEDWPMGLKVHAGIYYGEFINDNNDIYGDAVNTAARLCSVSKPSEILIGGNVFDGLSPINKDQFHEIGNLQFKGKKDATRVLSCMVTVLGDRTEVSSLHRAARAPRTESAEFAHGSKEWEVTSGNSLTLGRSPQSDVIINRPWVSRNHATLSINQGQLEFADHSSSGSVVRPENGQEIFVHRRTHLLTGRGQIFASATTEAGADTVVSYQTHEIG